MNIPRDGRYPSFVREQTPQSLQDTPTYIS